MSTEDRFGILERCLHQHPCALAVLKSQKYSRFLISVSGAMDGMQYGPGPDDTCLTRVLEFLQDLMVSVKQLATERLRTTKERSLRGLLTPTALRTIGEISRTKLIGFRV